MIWHLTCIFLIQCIKSELGTQLSGRTRASRVQDPGLSPSTAELSTKSSERCWWNLANGEQRRSPWKILSWERPSWNVVTSPSLSMVLYQHSGKHLSNSLVSTNHMQAGGRLRSHSLKPDLSLKLITGEVCSSHLIYYVLGLTKPRLKSWL